MTVQDRTIQMSSKSKDKDRDKKRKSSKHRSKEERLLNAGPFGMLSVNKLSDLHTKTGSEIKEALSKPSIKAVKAKVVPVEAPVDEARQKKRDLKEQVKREKEAAKRLGLINLLKVPKPLQKKFIQRMHEQQKSLFEFVLLDIAPIEFSLDSTVADATEAIRMMTGAQDVEISTTRTRQILEDLIELRMLRHLGRKLGLSKTERQIIIDKHFVAPQNKSKETDVLRKMLQQRIENDRTKVTNPKPEPKPAAKNQR